MVLTPDVGGDQQVHGGDRLAPRNLADGSLKPLGVLVQHGVDHVDEGLVGAPDAVTTGQQVSPSRKPSIWCSDSCSTTWPETCHVLVDLVGDVAGIPLLVGDFVGSLQTVGSGLIRSEDAEVVAGCS